MDIIKLDTEPEMYTHASNEQQNVHMMHHNDFHYPKLFCGDETKKKVYNMAS